ncbi:MAG: DMT family transporter [Acutalibacteraceae bacterium]|nr:DMT family transporter [Acutalibacteraceae bacterium]
MWLFFTLATTLIWGTAELFYKKGSHDNEKYGHLKVCIFVGLVMGIHAVFTLCTQDIGFKLSHIIEYLPVSACYIGSMALSFFGIRFIEESISDPIENTSGAICSLLCLLILGESISIYSWIAIAVIVIGILGVGFLEKKNGTRASRYGKKLAIIAFIMPFGYAIIDAIGSFLDVYYLDVELTPLKFVTEDSIELVANTAYELTFALVALILFAFIKIKKVKFEITKQKDKAIAAVCETAGQLTYVYAMSGNGAIAAPIISSVCVVSLLLSRIFLKEKLSAKQYVFIALVIVGILMLAVIDGE